MSIKATFEKGVFRPHDPEAVAELKEGERVEIDLRRPEAVPSEETLAASARSFVEFLDRMAAMPEDPDALPDLPYGPVGRNHDAYLADEYESRHEPDAPVLPQP